MALGAAGAAGLWVWLAPSSTGPASPTPLPGDAVFVGKPAPDFTLPILTAGPAASTASLALHSLRGKPVVLNFWASWCAPCRAEMPLLVRLSHAYSSRGVVFVGVNAEDEAADARRFMAQYHIDFPVVHSADQRVVTAYGLLGLPTTVIVGPDGVIQDKEVGGFIGPEGERALVKTLDALLR
jgi:cytochrome c biogenesis protein CcmG, thiol:disulfide interchange protein DsbE